MINDVRDCFIAYAYRASRISGSGDTTSFHTLSEQSPSLHVVCCDALR